MASSVRFNSRTVAPGRQCCLCAVVACVLMMLLMTAASTNAEDRGSAVTVDEFVATHSTSYHEALKDQPEEGDRDFRSRDLSGTEDIPPIPLPQWAPPKGVVKDPGRVIMFDVATREESIGSAADIEDFLPPSGSSSGFVPGSGTIGQAEDPEGSGLKNFSALSRVLNTEDYPWRVNVRLIMYFSDGVNNGTFQGSGVLIDGIHVLTVGHCVHSGAGGDWADSIRVQPAYDHGLSSYGEALSSSFISWQGWIVNSDWEYDMGIIRLARPVGGITGWHGYGYNNDNTFFTNTTFNNPNYPGTSHAANGQEMWYWYGTYDTVFTEIVYFFSQGYGGQSGSGGYVIDGSNRYVYTVLSHGTDGPDAHTGCTRITSTKFSSIQSIIATATPSTLDLAALYVQAGPSTITAGNQLTSFNYLVYNNSSATVSAAVAVGFYLSTNDNISTSDLLLQNMVLHNIYYPKSTLTVTLSSDHLPVIPADVPEGDYYVGIILDIDDYNTGNNDSDGWDAAPIHVNAAPSPTISGYVRTSGGTGILDVTMNGLPGSPTTNSSGFYTATVNPGWSGTVTPSKACYTFSPVSRSYSNVTSDQTSQNYTGSLQTYSISGQVNDDGGVGIPGVVMTGLPGNPSTDSTGHYAGTVNCGWSGRVTPSKACYTFSPVSRSYMNVTSYVIGQDYTGSLQTFTISGHVYDDGGVGISGVVMSGLPGNPRTDRAGYYTAMVDCGWSGTVTPSKACHTFSPVSRSYTNVTSDQANQDYTGYLQTYTISGYVYDDGGVGIPGVVMSGLPGNPSTNRSGYYIATVDCGWSGTVVPDDSECTFVPAFRTYSDVQADYMEQNYTCTVTDCSISGYMVYYDLVRHIPDVTVDLTGDVVATTVSDAAGFYSFDGLSPAGYQVTPWRTHDDDGVSIADVVKIRRHLAVLELFDTPYKYLAADVTCDGSVSISDVVKIRRYLAQLEGLPCGNWVFIDSSFAISDANWFAAPQWITGSLTYDWTDSSFIGVRLGDVNNTWLPVPVAAVKWVDQPDRASDAASVIVRDVRDALAGDIVEVTVEAVGAGQVSGVELHLSYAVHELTYLDASSDAGTDFTINAVGEDIHLVWEDLNNPVDATDAADLFTLRFRVAGGMTDSGEITISGEIVDTFGEPYGASWQSGWVVLASPNAVDPDNGLVPRSFYLSANYPNPFNPETNIAFGLPQASYVTLCVYNIVGQRVNCIASGEYAAGDHEAVWNGRDENGNPVGSGVYFYRLDAGSFTQTRKMTFMK